MKLDVERINKIIACPNCKAHLSLVESQDSVCGSCRQSYGWLTHTWNLIPSSWNESSDLWSAWEQLQENGVVSYKEDPEHNLNVGKRQVSIDFSRFCKFDGLVLDVGCGPQAWPSHFETYTEETRFVGVDPLVGDSPSDYTQFRALAEYLPFHDAVFDHVIFATSLDHFIDPVPALVEARRVCRPEGSIDIWVGEKSPDAPKPAVSPDWYNRLKKPEGAEDVFHFKRLSAADTDELINRAGLHVVKKEVHEVDQYRSNHFFKLQVKR
ncbi:MAG TPA: class I SAM-dependent methyltransferase [Pyrinomonadaceae bacterium]